MVSFNNMGRCGNFLFQAAATIGFSLKHNIEFTVPSTTKDAVWNPLYLQHLVHKKFDPELSKFIIHEVQHNFYDIPYPEIARSSTLNIFLQGYWQSYKYFDFCKEDIQILFNLPYSYNNRIVSIHVRRGDYLQYPHINPLAGRAYYEAAVKYFWLKGYKKFAVFSDDIPWCIEEFRDNVYKGCEFDFVQGTDVIHDLCAMSGCEHNIISNSTFAWWGAWLNRNPHKIVVCVDEANYYGPANKHLDISTLYPPEWIRIKY